MDSQAIRGDFARKLAQAILKMDDLDSFLNSLTQMVAEIFGVKEVSLYLFDEDASQYNLKAISQKGQESADDKSDIPMEEAVSWLEQRQRVLKNRLFNEIGGKMAPELKDKLNRTDTSVSMPLFAGERLIGVLNLGAKADNERFSKEDLELFSELTELLAAIINQAVYRYRVTEQRSHHQNILDNLVSGIIAIDPEKKVTVFNRAAVRVLGFKPEEVLGKDVRILQKNLADLLLDTLDGNKSYRREELYILPQNTLIGVSTAQFYDAKGKLMGACMVFASLAEIRKKEQMARQQNLDRYWSNMADSLVSEVKNSIVATKVFTEMFPQKYEDAEFRWNLYSTLKREMGKLDDFIEKVLSFAQPQKLDLQPCEINRVMEEAIDSALQDRDVGKIAFEKTYSPNLPPLLADYHQLKLAFAHIITNALEAMGKKGKLSISIAWEQGPEMLIYNLPEAIKELPQGEIVVVKVVDTGCGILPQNMLYLYDPFFTTKGARTGLGLSTARKIITKHRGIISAESKPEQGATFWICLPVSREV